VSKPKKQKTIGPKKINDTYYKLRDFVEDYLLYESFACFKEMDKLVFTMKQVAYDYGQTPDDAELQGKLIAAMIAVDAELYDFMEDFGGVFTEKVQKDYAKISAKMDTLRIKAQDYGLVHGS
jgi:hypothetical protein